MLFKIICISLAACILLSLLDTYSPQTKLPFLLGVVVSTAFVLLPSIRQVIQQISELANSAEYVSGPARVLIKCMLICFLSKTAADICVDCGQKLIASQIETAAKLTVIMVNIPLLVSIVSQLCTMVQI